MEFRLPPGRKQRHRKQIILFGIAVLVPALLLLIYTLHLSRQDRELRRRRAEDIQYSTAQAIGRRLAEHLNDSSRLLLQSLKDNPDFKARRTFETVEILFVSRVEGDRLHLPWESVIEEEKEKTGFYSDLIENGLREEFIRNNPLRAAELYKQARSAASGERHKNHARLLEIRALAKAGRDDRAEELSRSMLALPTDQMDEYSIPFCLFAAERLASVPSEIPAVVNRIGALAEENRWLSPAAYYLLLDVLKVFEGTGVLDENSKSMKEVKIHVQQSLALQERMTGLAGWAANKTDYNFSSSLGKSYIWEAYGEEPWILGLISEDPETFRYLVVFDAARNLETVLLSGNEDLSFPGSCRFEGGREEEGIRLGSPFTGLRLVFSEENPKDWAGSSLPSPVFYWLSLILVLSVTAFGMYLLLRDVRREMRLADLRSQFVSSVSHELKTPLTAIRMFAESLRMGKPAKQEMREEYLDTIVGESERLSRLLNNVLDFSKIEQGARSYSMELVPLEVVLENAARAIDFPLKQQHFVLNREIDPDLPDIRGDKDALEQAVLNLLHNALKFSGESREIGLSLYRKSGKAVIEVSDKGIGIRPENRERIFEKYFRETHPGMKKIPGTGLGLTIVGHIVAAHGGRITVCSKPGAGSTFSIFLPLEDG